MSLSPQRHLERVSAPATEPVTLAEAKLFLRIDQPDHDSAIAELITSARDIAEQFLKRALVTQSWKFTLHIEEVERETRLGKITIALPMGPIASISSVVAIAEDGSETTINSNNYSLNTAKDGLVISSDAFNCEIAITYTSGYGTRNAVPAPIRQGVLQHVAALFEGATDGAMIPDTARALYAAYREVRL